MKLSEGMERVVQRHKDYLAQEVERLHEVMVRAAWEFEQAAKAVWSNLEHELAVPLTIEVEEEDFYRQEE